jgi:hypothetical protein
MMSLRKRFSAVTAIIASLAIAAPAVASAAIQMRQGAVTPFAPGAVTPFAPNPNLCLSGVVDPGPFGPLGPYGPMGPYGKNGPLNGQTNPIGNAATCGGLFTYILRGGTLTSFVQGNLASVGH